MNGPPPPAPSKKSPCTCSCSWTIEPDAPAVHVHVHVHVHVSNEFRRLRVPPARPIRYPAHRFMPERVRICVSAASATRLDAAAAWVGRTAEGSREVLVLAPTR